MVEWWDGWMDGGRELLRNSQAKVPGYVCQLSGTGNAGRSDGLAGHDMI